MASVDTIALYERILWLVDPSELDRTSNAVLQEEFTNLANSVRTVAATFAKVEEVRDAVNQLEQGKASVSRSESLIELMDSLIQLQHELQCQIDYVANGMKTVDGNDEKQNEKRKRHVKMDVDAKASWKDSVSSSKSSKDGNLKKQKRVAEQPHESKMATPRDKKNDSKGSLAHGALRTLSTIPTINERISHETKNKWEKSLTDLKRVIDHQLVRDTHSNDTSATDIAVRALDAVVAILQKLEVMPQYAKEVRALIAALSDACPDTKVLRTCLHRAKTQLKTLERSHSSIVDKDSDTALATETVESLKSQLKAFQDLVTTMKKKPKKEKPKSIMKALEVLQKVMANDLNCTQHVHVRHAVEKIKNWICDFSSQDKIMNGYKKFAHHFVTYSNKMDDPHMQNDSQKLATGLLRLISTRKRKVSTDLSHSTSAKTSKNMRNRLVDVLTQAEQFKSGNFSLKQLNQVVKNYGDIMSYQSSEWNPLKDVTSRVCADKLLICIQMVEKATAREKYLKSINKWERLMDNHIARKPKNL
ncbi:hypothetical protein CCR75_006910 [Bremia lactucae]|uniref:Uncharacterized protein n=1 Tax=Bremia lactucae TaxID=4779 RepID=A0A976NYC4_BRELC|nr:hypothetical protein CCR75_006910 [Bremia lactucae]